MSARDVMERVVTGCGIDRPATVAGSDFETRQIVAEMNAAGKDVALRGEWSRMFVTVSIPAGTTAYTLPDDFREMAESGSIRTAYAPVRVVVMPEQWAFLAQYPSSQLYCHLTGGELRFAPALPEAATLTYQSKAWLADGKDAITDDGDALLVPESLVALGAIWRWKRSKGLPYDDHLAEYEADLEAQMKADRGA
jgi:hypothetical protein